MSPMWILWAYLAGVVPTWAMGARRIGLNLDDWLEESIQKAKREWSSSRRSEEYKRSWFYAQVSRVAALWFVIGALWPVSLPLVATTLRGAKAAEIRRNIKRRMKDAEAEIDRIKKQEGWD